MREKLYALLRQHRGEDTENYTEGDAAIECDLLAEFDRLAEENKALGEWECCDCGCRFNKPMKGAMGSVPGAMDGVIRCSSCVEKELLRDNLKELKDETRRLREVIQKKREYWQGYGDAEAELTEGETTEGLFKTPKQFQEELDRAYTLLKEHGIELPEEKK